MTKFLDLSNHNTITDYSKFKDSGLGGVILKASEGTTYTDDTMIEKYCNLVTQVNVGFYHYLKGTSSATDQAQHFYDLTKNKVMNIIPVLDVEDEIENVEQLVTDFLQSYYELSGNNMLIYSYTSFIRDNFSIDFCQSHNFWVADYNTRLPQIAKCSGTIVAWQYTDKCNEYAFIEGDVDCSVLKSDINFYLDELLQIPYSEDNTLANEYDDIKTLQRELNSQGYSDKQWNELDVDGIAGRHTLEACPTMVIGAIGNITKWIQNKLGIPTDGVYGTLTKEAVIVYQCVNCLKPDGVVGQKTWEKLLGMVG